MLDGLKCPGLTLVGHQNRDDELAVLSKSK